MVGGGGGGALINRLQRSAPHVYTKQSIKLRSRVQRLQIGRDGRVGGWGVG